MLRARAAINTYTDAHTCLHTHTHMLAHTHTRTHSHTYLPMKIYSDSACSLILNIDPRIPVRNIRSKCFWSVFVVNNKPVKLNLEDVQTHSFMCACECVYEREIEERDMKRERERECERQKERNKERGMKRE